MFTHILGGVSFVVFFVAVAFLAAGQYGLALILFIVALGGIWAYEILNADHMDETYGGLE